MKKTNIFYWVFTGLFALLMAWTAIPNITLQHEAVEGIHGMLGYPVYFIPFIGWAKLLGVAAILIPGFPRLKEWAYAGLVFDLVGAAYSVFQVPVPEGSPFFMILPLALAAASYFFYRKRERAKGMQAEAQKLSKQPAATVAAMAVEA